MQIRFSLTNRIVLIDKDISTSKFGLAVAESKATTATIELEIFATTIAELEIVVAEDQP